VSGETPTTTVLEGTADSNEPVEVRVTLPSGLALEVLTTREQRLGWQVVQAGPPADLPSGSALGDLALNRPGPREQVELLFSVPDGADEATLYYSTAERSSSLVVSRADLARGGTALPDITTSSEVISVDNPKRELTNLKAVALVFRSTANELVGLRAANFGA
jgi:hypothetical protein